MRTEISSVVDGEPAHASGLGDAPVGVFGEGAVDGHTIPLVRADVLGGIFGDLLRPDHATVLFVYGSEGVVRDDNLGLDHDTAVGELSDTERYLLATEIYMSWVPYAPQEPNNDQFQGRGGVSGNNARGKKVSIRTFGAKCT